MSLHLTAKEKRALKPPDNITVSEWADKYRILLPQTSPEPGRWNTNRVPYLRDIMDAFCMPEVEEIVFCKPTQVGGTEFIYNCLGYIISQDPAPALLVMPTIDLAEYTSRNRIQPMINSCEILRERKSSKADDFKLLEMKFDDMVFSLGGSNTPASLASRPERYLLLDEVDKYATYTGKEANPISLAYERTSNFWNRKILITSTPVLENGNIWSRLHACDIVLYYYIPCPFCGEYQVFEFKQIKWPKEEKDPKRIQYLAWYECEQCKAQIQEFHKTQMLLDGKWDPINPSNLDIPIKKIGFHLNSLYSPWRSFGQIAKEFLDSKDTPEKLQNFVNSWQGLPWIVRILHKKSEDIFKHKSSIQRLIIPNDCIALTAGVDPGQGGFWYVLLAWRENKSIHMVDHGFLISWDMVENFLLDSRYPNESENLIYPIWRAGVDTGGTKKEEEDVTMTEASYMFLRKVQITGRVFGTKGESTRKTAVRMTHRIIDKMPGPHGKPIRGGLTIWFLNTGELKDGFHYRLQLNIGQNGEITLHNDVDEQFSDHILAEEKRRNRQGIWEWIKVSTRNDLLDAFIIALAMGDPACWGGVSILQRKQALNNIDPRSESISIGRKKLISAPPTQKTIKKSGFLNYRKELFKI